MRLLVYFEFTVWTTVFFSYFFIFSYDAESTTIFKNHGLLYFLRFKYQKVILLRSKGLQLIQL